MISDFFPTSEQVLHEEKHHSSYSILFLLAFYIRVIIRLLLVTILSALILIEREPSEKTARNKDNRSLPVIMNSFYLCHLRTACKVIPQAED